MIANITAAAELLDPGLKNNRSATASPASGQPASPADGAINLDPGLFDRVNDLPGSTPDQAGEIADEQGAGKNTEFARASILDRPATAMAAQANQLPQTVLQLLQ